LVFFKVIIDIIIAMNEPSIFTRIINGEIPAHKIYEDDRVIAILDVHPISEGHTLVIPKKQIDHIWDLDADDYTYIWEVSKKLGLHIREIIGSTRVGVIVEGFGVPHAHIHLIPIYHSNDLKKFQDHNIEPDNEALARVASMLRM
jgi:histidine triad (HIT) family protein